MDVCDVRGVWCAYGVCMGVWCMVYGVMVWCVVYDRWCMVCMVDDVVWCVWCMMWCVCGVYGG